MYRTLTVCRLCDGQFFDKALKLKSTSPANELYASRETAINAEKFPLEVVMCQECRHVQLKHIVNPKRLFDDYVYKSGSSKFFANHFEKLAEQIVAKFKINSFILEVGSNDGFLLETFSKREIKCIGIEPSKVLAEECSGKNLQVYNSYLNSQVIQEIITKHGRASVVLGNNVFAHIEDLKNAFLQVFSILDINGVFVFEVAHLKFIFTDGIFDTIYHEHMSYHTAGSMFKFAVATGFILFKIEKVLSHGGSLRFYLSNNSNQEVETSVSEIIEEEAKLGLDDPKILELIEDKIKFIKNDAIRVMKETNEDSNSVYIGYGAPAKVVTFLAQMDLENIDMRWIIDDNPGKQQKYLPGSGFEVKSTNEIKDLVLGNNESNLKFNFLIFPWNLKDEIIERLRQWAPKNSTAIVFFPQVEKVTI